MRPTNLDLDIIAPNSCIRPNWIDRDLARDRLRRHRNGNEAAKRGPILLTPAKHLIGANIMPTRNHRHRRARDKGLRHNLTLQLI
jgi:hypothetical protein